jgi:lipopolysaccharide transport system permease protein
MKTIITSSEKTFINFSELKRYKSLLINLAMRDFLVRYKQAHIGISWALLKPLISTLVFGYIASKISKTETAADSFLNVAIALLLWNLFSTIFSDVSNSIVANSNLFSKVYFPKIIIPLSTILVCLIDFFISLIILIVLFFIADKAFHWQLILAPVFILLTIINGFGIGLFFATLFVKYRDVRFVVPVILQFGMYVTPVIFSSDYYLQRLPDVLHWLFCLNPMVGAIDGFKYSILGSLPNYNLFYFILSLAVSFIFLVIGIKYFYKFERNFVDYI